MGKSRTRRPGAGLSAQKVSSPAVQLLVRRPPAKRSALFVPALILARPRGCGGHTCGGQFAHRVCVFAQPRTHAVHSKCAPAHGFCFPGQGESLTSVPCGRGGNLPSKSPRQTSMNTQNVGPPVPPTHRNARKAELCSLAFRAFPRQPAVCGPKGRTKPASSQKKGEIGERAQAFSLRTETLEKLSSAPWLFKRFPYLPAVCGRMAA